MSKKKNIIVGPAFPLRGGIANFNEALCKAFGAAGIDSKIYSFSLQYPEFLFPGKTQFDKGSPKPTNIKIKTLINSVNPYSWYQTAKQIKAENPEYIIIRYWLPFMAPCLGTIARLVKWRTAIKVIAICDNILPHEKRFGDKWLTSYFIKSCHAFVVMSNTVLEELKNIYSKANAVVLPHPIYDIFGEIIPREEALHHIAFRQAHKYLLFFGFIRKYKGLDLLLDAMTDPRVRNLNIKLFVVGECYENFEYYITLVRQNKLDGNVVFKPDYIPSGEVKNYFCSVDMVVQPYKSASQSGVTQIAYHFEKPMLVTNVGGLAEMVPHMKVGYVVEPDSKAIADAIVHFYENNMATPFIENIKIEKKRFQWSAFVEGVSELYNKI
ncbi:MAG: glycosyltransferase [Bacteroidia bacterium]|nr:glycosyltransferase [Bacteroidia bacterium]